MRRERPCPLHDGLLDQLAPCAWLSSSVEWRCNANWYRCGQRCCRFVPGVVEEPFTRVWSLGKPGAHPFPSGLSSFAAVTFSQSQSSSRNRSFSSPRKAHGGKGSFPDSLCVSGLPSANVQWVLTAHQALCSARGVQSCRSPALWGGNSSVNRSVPYRVGSAVGGMNRAPRDPNTSPGPRRAFKIHTPGPHPRLSESIGSRSFLELSC